jgi:UDP-3-O-[3-hydroxymyristoyl] glucosamine N-acyltransferase
VPAEFTLQAIAEQIDGQVAGDQGKIIQGVAPFETADAAKITFAGGKKYLKHMDDCRAGAIIVPLDFEAPGKNLIGVKNPQLAFTRVVNLFHPAILPPAGIDAAASLGKDAQIGDDTRIGAFVTIGDRASIGSGTVIQNGAYIGPDVIIGDQVLIHPNVTILDRCHLGSRVIVHSGTVIGSDGYGFVPDGGKYHKIPQLGIVQIDDDVEIGAGNTIDRATFGRTWIQRGVKTDNLVHIAHNVVIGEDSVIVAQVGIAGSTRIGHHAILAGQAGISGHLKIGNRVTVGPMTGVGKDVSDGEVVSSGLPSMPHRTWLRVQRQIPSLPDMRRKIAELEKKIAELENTVKKD